MSNSRLEKFIYAICSMEVSDLPAPLSRIEILWNCLITGETPDFEPQSRNEQYLMAMLGLYELDKLPTPMSRGEKLLYKIAMGETDLSDIPAYLSRYEELLGYLAENGGVGDFEYILQTLNQRLSMLYSTKERPMKQAVIKGDTLVNELPRPSLKNTMINTASQKLNQGYDAVNVVDGEFKSAILRGLTLVNLYPNINREPSKFSVGYGITVDDDNWVHIANREGRHQAVVYKDISLFKPNTTYTFIVEVKNNTLDRGLNLFQDYQNGIIQSSATIEVGFNGTKKILVTTVSDFTDKIKVMQTHKWYAVSGEIDYRITIIEGDYTNVDIPYFTGMQSVKLPVLTTTGKNLFRRDIKINTGQGIRDTTGLPYDAPDHCYTEFIRTEPNTTYVITQSHQKTWVFAYNKSKKYIKMIKKDGISGVTFTTNDETYYIRFDFAYIDISEIINGFQFEQGSTATSYEPYQSITLSTPSDLELRKVGDIQDEFDALTGQVTERVGEVVLDGSEEWQEYTTNVVNTYCGVVRTGVIEDYKGTDYLNDKLNKLDDSDIDNEGIRINSGKRIFIRFNRNKGITDLETFKQYLSQNPITIQYQLATPTTKTINPTITDQDGATQTKLHSFNDGHLSVSSQGLLPSAVDYEVPTNNSYYLPDMLTLGAQYTSRGSADCNATIDGKLLALGKNRTFTTPSSVTDRLMVLDAPVDDLMFIKGDQTAKDFGYFERMKSVGLSNKMPVLTTSNENPTYAYLNNIPEFINGYNRLSQSYGIKALCDSDVDGFILSTKTEHGFSISYDKSSSTLIVKNFNTDTGYNIKEINDVQLNDSELNILYDGWRLSIWVNEIRVLSDFDMGRSHDGNKLYLNNLSKLLVFEDVSLFNGSYGVKQYKSNILSASEDVILRGIGDVQDTLDCLTGEVVQNIGEVVLDGSEKWFLNNNSPTDTNLLRFTTNSALPNAKLVDSDSRTHYLTDKFEKHNDWKIMECAWVHYNDRRVNVVIKKDKLITLNNEGFRLWVSQNPITVQYQLATESSKTIDLTTVDQDGQSTKLKTFNDITHVEINADNLIPSVDVEVATKISETLSTLGLDHHDISETQDQLGQTIDEQTENTDATMMATTEIYEQTL